MQYIPIHEKSFILPVDNLLLFVVLALLALMGEQAKRDRQGSDIQLEDLPVIAF